MPTYDYRCTSCGYEFEAVQRFTDSPLTECPECGSRLRKVYNAVGVVFKGTGFYRTDSRESKRSAGAGGKPAAAKESSSTGSDGASSGSSGGGSNGGGSGGSDGGGSAGGGDNAGKSSKAPSTVS